MRSDFLIFTTGIFLFYAIQGYTQSQTFERYYQQGLEKIEQNELQKAIIDFTIALEIDPRLEGYLARAQTRQTLGQWKGALDDYNSIIELSPRNAVFYNNRGNIKDLLGRTIEAIHDFDRALAIDSSYDNAYYNRAIARFRIQDFEGSRNDFSKVLQSQPSDTLGLVGMGLSLNQLGKTQEACQYFRKAKELKFSQAQSYLDQYCKLEEP